jgi:glycosyltransferase involved in cell wall biosynthesis
MNLLCINYEYPPIGGGGGVVCQGLADALVKKGYHIDVVTSGMKGLPTFEMINGVHVHRVSCIRRHKHYVTFPEMLTLVPSLFLKALHLTRQKNYCLNHTHFIFPSGVVSYLLKKKTGIPYIVTCHGSDVPGYNPDRFKFIHMLLRPLWQKVINGSEGLSSPSIYLKELIETQIRCPVEVIPNGYDLPAFIEGAKQNRILLVTRLFKRKGVQFFIEAVADLETDWEILVAGDGPYLSTLKKLAKDNPSIKFLGFVKGQALIDLYRSARIFVFPSIQENFPVVLLEAMSTGCAIITTDAPGCKEVVGDAAIITPCRSVDAIRSALERLLHNPEEINWLSKLARHRAVDFSWSKIANDFDCLSKQYMLPPVALDPKKS